MQTGFCVVVEKGHTNTFIALTHVRSAEIPSGTWYGKAGKAGGPLLENHGSISRITI